MQQSCIQAQARQGVYKQSFSVALFPLIPVLFTLNQSCLFFLIVRHRKPVLGSAFAGEAPSIRRVYQAIVESVLYRLQPLISLSLSLFFLRVSLSDPLAQPVLPRNSLIGENHTLSAHLHPVHALSKTKTTPAHTSYSCSPAEPSPSLLCLTASLLSVSCCLPLILIVAALYF